MSRRNKKYESNIDNVDDYKEQIISQFKTLKESKQTDLNVLYSCIKILLQNNINGLIVNLTKFLIVVNKLELTHVNNSMFYNIHLLQIKNIHIISQKEQSYVFNTTSKELNTLYTILNKITNNTINIMTANTLMISKNVILKDYKKKLLKEIEYAKNNCKRDISILRQKLKKKFWKNLPEPKTISQKKFMKCLNEETQKFTIK